MEQIEAGRAQRASKSGVPSDSRHVDQPTVLGGGSETTTQTRDVVELIYDLIATMSADNRNKLDVSWLQSFYQTQFGRTDVVYSRDDGAWIAQRPKAKTSLTQVLKTQGTPNIVTWSAWMVISQHIQSNAPLAFQDPSAGL